MLKLFGNKKSEMEELVKSPFSMEYVEGITIRAFKNRFIKQYEYYALVDFERDDVSAQQKFKGDSLVDVFVKVHDFCEKLK